MYRKIKVYSFPTWDKNVFVVDTIKDLTERENSLQGSDINRTKQNRKFAEDSKVWDILVYGYNLVIH